MYFLGIDLGGTNIAAGICDETGKLLIKGSVPTKGARTADEITKSMAELSASLAAKAGAGRIDYAGIAAPGTADRDINRIIYANNLPFLNYPIIEKFSEFSGIKNIYIENDANAAAYGEYVCGSAKGASVAVIITLGTGVGGGIIIDDKIFDGFNYAGGEIGHMVIRDGGKLCTCGRRGCFESYASATALIRMTKEKMLKCKDSAMWGVCSGDIDKVNGRTAFDAKRMGDKAGREVVNRYVRYLACGIVNLINLFQPAILCIGGGISNERDYLLDPLKKIIEREQYSRNSVRKTEIRIAALRNDAGIIGAAMLGKKLYDNK